MLLRDMEPEKYWSFPSSYNKEKREDEIEKMISFGYYFQLKTDGNYSAFICDFDGDKRLITRGISKTTGEYGRVEDKVFFFDSIANAFDKSTRIMGEIYYDNGIDKHVGSVLRCKEQKAKSIQDAEYYENNLKNTKISAKDRRDIENSDFFNKKLKWRIFDVWYYNGESLMETPWIERQKLIPEIVKKIDNPLVSGVASKKMDENFYDSLGRIFEAGGEGVVCYNPNGMPDPGARTAHKTCKIKQEITTDVDCFIIGTEPAKRDYTGKEYENWIYWLDIKTNELMEGQYFTQYRQGDNLIPITKGYYYGWPGAIFCGVYDKNGEIYNLCKVSGLTEEFKTELRDNYEKWHMCPVTINGMSISKTGSEISIRHPILKSVRNEDIDIKDCTLEKIL